MLSGVIWSSLTLNQRVVGSSPTAPTNLFKDLGSAGSGNKGGSSWTRPTPAFNPCSSGPPRGDRKGQFSMHVSGNRVITFIYDSPDVTVLDLEDYH